MKHLDDKLLLDGGEVISSTMWDFIIEMAAEKGIYLRLSSAKVLDYIRINLYFPDSTDNRTWYTYTERSSDTTNELIEEIEKF